MFEKETLVLTNNYGTKYIDSDVSGLDNPQDMAVLNDNILVSDSGTHTIEVLNFDGEYRFRVLCVCACVYACARACVHSGAGAEAETTCALLSGAWGTSSAGKLHPKKWQTQDGAPNHHPPY